MHLHYSGPHLYAALERPLQRGLPRLPADQRKGVAVRVSFTPSVGPLGAFVALSLLLAGEAVRAQTLDLPEDAAAEAHAVSSDGALVVGEAGGQVAQWTQAGGVASLGTNGVALDVSGDGSVIVGHTPGANGRSIAFRRTQAGGIQTLGVIGSDGTAFLDESKAEGISRDGAVIVGSSHDATVFATRAFRWTQAGGMQSLGTLAGGNASFAYGASADGSVVVGSSNSATSAGQEAFRWTQAGGMVALGKLNAGNSSEAFAVSDDGTVVVGQAADGAAFNSLRAFRWTQATGLQSLGVLNFGTSSQAHDISGDGLVIVGGANDGAGGNQLRAFRWTQAGGMQTVEDWLRGQGAVIAADVTRIANGTNSDGTVIVGRTADGKMFIARGGADGAGGGGGGGVPAPAPAPVATQRQSIPAGLITVDDLSRSIASTATANSGVAATIGTSLNGAGSRPLDRRAGGDGKSVVWLTGDWGREDHGARDGTLSLGEFGVGHDLGPVQTNLVGGYAHMRQDTLLGGSTEVDAGYAKVEVLSQLTGDERDGLWLVLTGVGVWGKAAVQRNYLTNGGLTDSSKGTSDIEGYGFRGRLEWEQLIDHVSPYTELSWSRTCLAGYTESGGAFPVAFNENCDSATEARLGSDLAYPIDDSVRLLGIVEGVHRFEETANGVSGQVIGLGGFSFAGAKNEQTWARGGAGVEFDLDAASLSFMANASTVGETPSVLLSSSLRVRF